MTARVLVVDDIFANVKLLEAKLQAEYFDVLTAMNGRDALDICERGLCDIVLLDVMMPEMDGFEVCRRLKASPQTQHLPVVMVTALDQPAEKVRGLDVGADDFLTKPIDDIALLTRVKNLARNKMLIDELRNRVHTLVPADGGLTPDEVEALTHRRAKILLVDDRPSSAERLMSALEDCHDIVHEADPQKALFALADDPSVDMVLINLSLMGFDGLRLCGQLKSLERTRNLPIMVVVDLEDRAKLMRGLDMGVNDYVIRPIDRQELMARVKTQLKRKVLNDHMRTSVQTTVEMAYLDALTSLHNRRFLEAHLSTQMATAKAQNKPLSYVILDIDHFKAINDAHGHDGGDDVLREFAQRLKKTVRNMDVAARYGGEEFVVVMPESDVQSASAVAERIRRRVEETPILLSSGQSITVTCSIGFSVMTASDTTEMLMKRADMALYRAKREGRNRVVLEAA